MLKGESRLILTHDTIREAVERYLRAGLVDGEKLEVVTIEAHSGGYAGTRDFEVTVKEVAPFPELGS